jgi:hypothetical protein
VHKFSQNKPCPETPNAGRELQGAFIFKTSKIIFQIFKNIIEKILDVVNDVY